MTLLIISPDYASHLIPLAALGTAWRDAGERVVVASGEATAGIAASFGYETAFLQLGRGSNPGVIRAEKQPDDEADSLRGFFDATRHGMVPTLAYQARERLVDLMWRPVEKARATLDVVEAVRPDAILVDHLAYGARLGLWAGDVPYADVVLGHPTALPVGDEVYGKPPQWPRAFHPDPAELAELDVLCRRVAAGFTAEWNTAGAELAPGRAPVDDAFALHGPLVLFHYPEAAGGARARSGSSRRTGTWVAACVPSLPTPRSTRGSAARSRSSTSASAASSPSARTCCAPWSRRFAGRACGPRSPVVRPPSPSWASCPPGGSCASTSRRCVCCGRRPCWSRTAATTRSPRPSAPRRRCWSCRSRPTSSPVPRPSSVSVSARCSTPTEPRSGELRDALLRLLGLTGAGVELLAAAAGSLAQDPGPARAFRAVGASAIS